MRPFVARPWRRGLLLVAAAGAVLAAPSAARASTVEVRGAELTYTAGAGQTNRVVIAHNDTEPTYQVQDAGASMTAGAGCREPSAAGAGGTVTQCDREGVASIRVALGDGDDVVDFGFSCMGNCPPKVPGTIPAIPTVVDGGAGRDTLVGVDASTTLIGGPGADTISGGPADDVVDARDGDADTVTCGGGADTATVDPADSVAADCETVDNGAPASPPGPVGASINDGAQYTNDPDVTISLRWPRLASSLWLSNDGGFGAAQSFPVAATVPWRLDSSGPERLPKTIYVRFSGGESGPETYQDDIILDQTAPTITSASTAGDATASAAWASAATKRKLRLRLKVRDAVSGVAAVQVTGNRRKPGRRRPYRTRLTYATARRAVFVRASDRAGNWSRWKRARRR